MSEQVLSPISESNPCGTDYKYEDDFLAIEAEIDKSNAMTEGVSTDWNVVLEATHKLLCESTKDTKVFCWWAYALWKKNGFIGLEKALGLFNEFLATFQVNLFPKSKKVKRSSMAWLEEMLNEEILDERGTITTTVDTKTFLELFSHLEKNFSLALEEEISIFRKMRSALERLNKEEERKAQAPKANASVVATSNEVNVIDNDTDATKVLRSLKKSAGLLHQYYREKDISDIKALRLVRLISWIDVDSLPANEEGKTPLNAPSEESLNQIDNLIAEESFDLAFSHLENIIAVSPFWIEGHFMASTLLEKMGHMTAAKEVKNALISFVKMDESILELSFRDTTPFASVKFKQWLSEDMGTVSIQKQEDDTDDDKEEIIESAYAFAKKKQVKEAMGLLQREHAKAVNKEDKFHWRLAKAELAAEFGKKDVALALLEDLIRDIDTYKLDAWKPELAGKVFNLYLNTFDRTNVDVEHLNKAYARLCKIDIAQALEITI